MAAEMDGTWALFFENFAQVELGAVDFVHSNFFFSLSNRIYD